MADPSAVPKQRVPLDSAILLTVVAAILYFFGTAFRTARLAAIGVPLEFVRQWTLQEYALVGGIFLAILAPLVMVPDLVLAASSRMRERVFATVAKLSILRLGVLAIYVLFIVLIIMLPIAQRAAHTAAHYRVVKAVPKVGVVLSTPIENTFYVSGTERELVFMDRWGDPNANLIVVARDDLAAVVLKREITR